MDIVIKLPDKDYSVMLTKIMLACYGCKIIELPKGHGRLIDISQIDKDKIESGNPVISLMVDNEYIEAVSLDYLNGLQTIVEADECKAESEG